MEKDDNLPVAGSSSNLPAGRSISTPELEAVIRRALELQAASPTRGDHVSEEEVVKIGQEIGLDPATVRRAMAEVRIGGAPAQRTALDAFVGESTLRASRTIRQPAADVAALVDRYLRESEFMVAQRRAGEKTQYVRDKSITATLSRVRRTVSRRHEALNFEQLDVTVMPLDESSCLVELGVDLGVMRGGLLAGVFGSSTAAAGAWATIVWGTTIADPLMLLGLPLLGGAWAGMRAIYNSIARSAQVKLESLLDRIEHDL